MSTPQRHSSVTWEVKSIPTQKRKKKKSKLYWTKEAYTNKWSKEKDNNPEMSKLEPSRNKEIP